MTVEIANAITQLNPSYPAAGDPKGEGDDHIRLIKFVLQYCFPNIAGPVTWTDTQLNNILVSPTLSGVPTAPSAALNTNTTQIATTAFVLTAVAAASLGGANLPSQTGNARKRLTTDGATIAWEYDKLPLSTRTTNTILGTADAATFIDITGGAFTQTFAAAATLGAGWECVYRYSGNSGAFVTLDPNGAELIDGQATLTLYSGATRIIQCDGTKFTTIPLVGGVYKNNTPSSGNWNKPTNVTAFDVRATGGGSGGGGGGGGGSGRGINSNSGSGGSGGSGGAGGQSGQSTRKVIPGSDITGTTVAYTVAASAAGGTAGAGGAGATSGGSGNNGTAGGNGAAGNPSSFGTPTDSYYVLGPGGAAGNNGGNPGTAGSNGNAGGAAVTNSASIAAFSISQSLAYSAPTVNGSASQAGSNQTSAAPGTQGGQGGTSSTTYASGTATDAGGSGGSSNAVLGSAGNAGSNPGGPTYIGAGGRGGGGGGGSAGVGAGGNAATGAGGAGSVGGAGNSGEIEIIEIL